MTGCHKISAGFIFGVCLLFVSSVCAETPIEMLRVQATADPTTITIGDEITFTLLIEAHRSIKVHRPGWGAGLGNFQIKDYEIAAEQVVGDVTQWTEVYTISTFTIGEYEIPPIPVAYQIGDSTPEVVASPAIQIMVESVVPSEEDILDIKDLKPPLVLYGGIDRTRLAIVLSICALVLLLVVWYLWRLFRPDATAPSVWVVSPYDEAVAALEQLRNDDLVEQGAEGEFARRLSEILRIYLGRRYEFNCIDLTTMEIQKVLQMLECRALNSVRDQVLTVLHDTDLVKFAEVPLEAEHSVRLLDMVALIVEKTHEIPDEAERAEQPVLEESTTESSGA